MHELYTPKNIAAIFNDPVSGTLEWRRIESLLLDAM